MLYHHINLLELNHHNSVVLRSSRNPSNPTTPTTCTDGYLKPNFNCSNAPFDDVDDIVFEVLPSPRPKDACSFETLVTLDENLECQGRECAVSTVRVVEVMAGMSFICFETHIP